MEAADNKARKDMITNIHSNCPKILLTCGQRQWDGASYDEHLCATNSAFGKILKSASSDPKEQLLKAYAKVLMSIDQLNEDMKALPQPEVELPWVPAMEADQKKLLGYPSGNEGQGNESTGGVELKETLMSFAAISEVYQGIKMTSTSLDAFAGPTIEVQLMKMNGEAVGSKFHAPAEWTIQMLKASICLAELASKEAGPNAFSLVPADDFGSVLTDAMILGKCCSSPEVVLYIVQRNRRNQHIVFCLDESGSMGFTYEATGPWVSHRQTLWKCLCDAFYDFLDSPALDADQDVVTVIQFDSNARVTLRLKSLSEAKAFTLQMHGGGTKFITPIRHAKEEFKQGLQKYENHVPLLVFMSDGSSDDDPIPEMKKLSSEVPGLMCHTVFFGTASGKEKLKNMAHEVNGEFHEAVSAIELKATFRWIAEMTVRHRPQVTQLPSSSSSSSSTVRPSNVLHADDVRSDNLEDAQMQLAMATSEKEIVN